MIEGNRDGTVQAMYWVKRVGGGTSASEILHINIGVQVTPTLDNVKDANGEEIDNGESTTSTTVTLSGKASNSQKVEIFDGTTSNGTADVDASGDWSKQLTGLTLTTHSFTAKGLYGSNPVSTARTLTVIALGKPTIVSVRGFNDNNDIPDHGFTIWRNLVLRGTALNGQDVEIFDGITSRGRTTANASGDWEAWYSGIGLGTHSFTAKGLYGSNPVSTAHTLTVLAVETPTIASVKDLSDNYIADGGSTTSTTVTLSGKATKYQKVLIMDVTTFCGYADVDASGDWSKQVPGLALGVRRFTAFTVSGTQGSNTWTITVVPGPVT
ncbi:hypothetical protein ASC85_30640 [Pseudomonas sp. Root401]|nr:hypothetical protein ASC85_30640 [Pseudomonas sp. Root401]